MKNIPQISMSKEIDIFDTKFLYQEHFIFCALVTYNLGDLIAVEQITFISINMLTNNTISNIAAKSWITGDFGESHCNYALYYDNNWYSVNGVYPFATEIRWRVTNEKILTKLNKQISSQQH